MRTILSGRCVGAASKKVRRKRIPVEEIIRTSSRQRLAPARFTGATAPSLVHDR